MNPGMLPQVSSLMQQFPAMEQPLDAAHFQELHARHRTSAIWLIPCAVLAVVALAAAADAIGQKPHPGVPYYGPSGTDPNQQYAQQNPQSTPQNVYAQPQYSAPPQGYPDQPQPNAPQQTYPDQQPQYAPQQPYVSQPYDNPQNYADQQPNGPQGPYADQDQGQVPAQSLSAENLEQLLAPIALYPDSLLAQILAASTYPAQVAVADQWVQQMRAAGYGSPDQIAAGANAQTNWDPSVKALTAFPDVLDMLNHNLEWTTNLGNAYYNQPQDVMQTVQVLRQRAEQAGNLQSTPQEDVENDQGYIDLAPTNPQIVYVPTYNPWAVYGEPIAPCPGFSFFGAFGDFFGATPIQYGLSFALGAFDRMPFGWMAWGLDWLGHAILFDHSGYYTHSRTVADWGLPRGGPRAYARGGAWAGTRGGAGGRDWDGRGGQYQNGGRGYDGAGNNQRSGWSNNRSGAGSYVRPAQGFPEPGRLDYSNRTSPQRNDGYRPETYPGRGQTYANRGYETRPQNYGTPGYNYTGRSNYGYTGPRTYTERPSFSYSSPSQSYRTPAYRPAQPEYSRPYSQPEYSNRSYQNYANTARNERSGGFHLFGGGTPKAYSSPRAPTYSYKAPKNFGGGQHSSFGGGHMSEPKMSHSSGRGGGHRR